MPGGFDTECDFRTVNSIDARISAWRAACCDDIASREKAQFHQAPPEVFLDVERIEDSGLSATEIDEGTASVEGSCVRGDDFLVERELHLTPE